VNRFKVLAFGLAAVVSTASAQKVGWSTGYFAAWAQGGGNSQYTIGGAPFTPDKISWSAYTHMVHFSVTPNNDGSINIGGMGLNASMITSLVTEAHAHNVKAIICVGGGGTGGQYAAAAANATVRAKFIQNMIAFMQQYKYDGLDIDWEDNIQDAQYLALFKELRAACDKLTPKPLITVAVAAYFSDRAAPVHPYIDQMNNMSYWTALKDMDGVMQAFTDKGVPKNKLAVGLGLDYTENPMELDCDPVSAKNKTTYAIDKAYGGIMVWEIEMDARRNAGKTPIHDVLATYVDKNVTKLSSRFPGRGKDGVVLSIRGDKGSPRIEFNMPKAAFVNMGLYDMQGNRVKSLLSGSQQSGMHSLLLNGGPRADGASALKPGAYVVKLATDAGEAAAGTVISK
jgi:GH18 family chitinase